MARKRTSKAIGNRGKARPIFSDQKTDFKIKVQKPRHKNLPRVPKVVAGWKPRVPQKTEEQLPKTEAQLQRELAWERFLEDAGNDFRSFSAQRLQAWVERMHSRGVGSESEEDLLNKKNPRLKERFVFPAMLWRTAVNN